MARTARWSRAEAPIERLRMGVFYRMADLVPPGTAGNVSVDTFEITPDTWQGFGVEWTRTGTYARLKVNGEVLMSDTDIELRTNYDAIVAARGDVLIGGLGLGCIVLPILAKPSVTSVTVVESDSNVISLVEPALRNWQGMSSQTGRYFREKLRPVEYADVHRWRPPAAKPKRRYDFVYFDIWQDLCTDHVADIQALHKAFRPYVRIGGRVTSWEFEHLRDLKRSGRWR